MDLGRGDGVTTTSSRHLHLVDAAADTDVEAAAELGGDAIAALIDAAHVWALTTMPIEDAADVPVCRHLQVVPPPPD